MTSWLVFSAQNFYDLAFSNHCWKVEREERARACVLPHCLRDSTMDVMVSVFSAALFQVLFVLDPIACQAGDVHNG